MSIPITTLALGNDWLIYRKLTVYDAALNRYKPATGLTVSATLSATPEGAAIDASLIVTLTERGVSGEYSGVIDGSNTTAHLTAFLGQVIYQRVIAGATGDFNQVRKLLVAAFRE
jgi:hypothetical protein